MIAVRKGNCLPRRIGLAPILMLLGLAWTPSAIADQVVYFVNGKAIMVKSVLKGDKFTVLEMDGGGRMGVPTEQILRIEDYEISAAAPQAVAPPIAPPPSPAIQSAAQPGGPQASAPAGAGLPPAPLALGPGVGGVPDQGGQGLARLRPLSLGGDAAATQPPAFPRQAAGMGPAVGGRALGGMLPGPGLGGPARATATARPGMGGRGRGGRGRPMMYGYQPPPPATAPAPEAAPAPPPAPAPDGAAADADEGTPQQTDPPVEEAPPADGGSSGSEEN